MHVRLRCVRLDEKCVCFVCIPFSSCCVDDVVVRLQFGVDHFGYRWALVICTRVGAWLLESSHDPGTFCNGCKIPSSGLA